MTNQERKWLDLIRLASNRNGEREDMIPKKLVRRFEQNGWVNRYIPHNIAHKERLVISSRGLAALKDSHE